MSDRAKYWQGLIAAWERSGLTQAEFCRRRGVKPVSFAWWKRKLGGTKGRAAKPARRRSVSEGNGRVSAPRTTCLRRRARAQGLLGWWS